MKNGHESSKKSPLIKRKIFKICKYSKIENYNHLIINVICIYNYSNLKNNKTF